MKLDLVSARAKTRLSYPKMKTRSSGKIGNNEGRFLSKIFLPPKPKKPIAPQALLLYSKQEYFVKITKNN